MSDEPPGDPPSAPPSAAPPPLPAPEQPAGALPPPDRPAGGQRSPDQAAPDDKGNPKGSGWAPPRRNRATTIVIVVVIIAALLIILYAWRLWPFSSAIETTDDANVDGVVTIISPQVSGYVVEIPVNDYRYVHRGDMIARIDPTTYQQKVDQSKAQLDYQLAQLRNSAQTERQNFAALREKQATLYGSRGQLANNQAEMSRIAPLAREGALAIKDRDQAMANLRLSQAQVRQGQAQVAAAQEQIISTRVQRGGLRANVETARAQLEQARTDLARTVIRAPVDGRLAQLGVRVGAYVQSGTQLTYLVPQVIWVSANYKERQLARMTAGQPATVAVDALDHAEIRGRVEIVSPATGSQFQVIKPDNATGNFVKVPQRITVRIALDRNDPLFPRLSPGMSVTAKVDTTDGPDPREERRREERRRREDAARRQAARSQ